MISSARSSRPAAPALAAPAWPQGAPVRPAGVGGGGGVHGAGHPGAGGSAGRAARGAGAAAQGAVHLRTVGARGQPRLRLAGGAGVLVAENSNARTDVSFSDLELRLSFHGMVIAILRADPFDVPKKGKLPLGYVARSSGIPLDDAGRAAMDAALNDGVVPLSVAARTRTHWKVNALFAVKYWTRLRCELRFFWLNGTALDFS